MFITHQENEAAVLSEVAPPGQQCWHAVQVTAEGYWFLLTIEEIKFEGMPRRHSLLIARDTDLVAYLDSLEIARPVSLLCMIPARKSASGRWAARSVAEVWVGAPVHGRMSIFFRDSSGDEFGDGFGVAGLRALQGRRQLLTLGNS